MRHALLNARTFASLRRHRNYRLYFAGQVVSLSGTWMQNIALAWLIVGLTHSPVAVGLLAFLRFAPFTVFSLPAGVLADRLDNRRTMMVTQAVSMVISAVLAVLRAQRADGALDGLRPRSARGHGGGLRRAEPARAHVPAGRAGRAPERRRAERQPLQRLARDRPGNRRRRDRDGRGRRLLRSQRRQFPGRARRARADAKARALPARAARSGRSCSRGCATGSATCGGRRRSGSSC